jgi:lysozyme family protein
MKDFEQALDFCLAHETVYAKNHYGDLSFAIAENESNDPGGVTKYGIDQASHPDVDIQNLTLTEAIKIYRADYWEKSHANIMPWPLSQVHFDGSVNTGIGQQAKFIQRAVGVVADGAWGPATKEALTNAIEDIGPEKMAQHVCDQKETFYRQLVETKPHLQKFLKGWINRLDDLRKDCGLS